jgi:hypothetical protein
VLSGLPQRLPIWENKLLHSDAKDAIMLITSLTWDRLSPFVSRLVMVAVKQGAIELWGHILDAAITGLGTDRRVLETVVFFKACEVFGFGPIVARLERSLEKEGLSRLNVVASIPEYFDIHTSSGVVTEWRLRYTRHILESLADLGHEEVIILVEAVKQGDLRFVRDM